MITGLEPVHADGYRHCIVAVDCFSKWTEIIPIMDRTSRTIANWMYRELLPRFGKPRWVRVDAGREFRGDFERLCGDLGVTVRVASSAHPQANGQVERVNREIKTAIRKYSTMAVGSSWFDWIPEVLMGLRMLCTRAHGYSPFMVTFK